MTQQKQKKVLIVTRDLSYPGGTETFIAEMMVLVKKDIEVYLVETESHGAFKNSSIYEDLISNGVVILDPIGNDDSFWSLEKARKLQQYIIQYNIGIVHSFLFNADTTCFIAKIGSRVAFNLFERIESYETLLKIWEQYNFHEDIVEPLNFTWFSSKFCNFSIALEKDTSIWHERKKIIDNELEPIISKYTDKIFGVSSAIKEKWEAMVNKTVHIIPCASIGLEEIKKMQLLQKDRAKLREIYVKETNNTKVFFTLSRLEPEKGLEELIDAFILHNVAFPNDKLFIAGEGSLREDLKQRSINCDSIIFLGHLNRQEVLQLISLSDVFCLLSYSEGLPLSLQESMAGEKIVIATNIGGIPDLVSQGETGFLVEVNNIPMTLKAMNNISLLSENTIKNMGKSAVLHIKKNFLKEKAYEAYLNCYKGK